MACNEGRRRWVARGYVDGCCPETNGNDDEDEDPTSHAEQSRRFAYS